MNTKVLLIGLFLLGGFLYAEDQVSEEISKNKFGFLHLDTKTTINFDSDVFILNQQLGKSKEGLKKKELTISWPGLSVKVNPKWEYDSKTKEYRIVSGKYVISGINIENTEYSTIDGVAIGDDFTKILKIYGEPYSKTNVLYQYLHNEPDEVWNLNFFLRDGKAYKIAIIRGD